MTDKSSSHDSNHRVEHLNGGVHTDAIFFFLLAAAIFLSYGYEIFNFNLTIDEEIHAIHSGKWRYSCPDAAIFWLLFVNKD
jgi:hypothetical protein